MQLGRECAFREKESKMGWSIISILYVNKHLERNYQGGERKASLAGRAERVYCHIAKQLRD